MQPLMFAARDFGASCPPRRTPVGATGGTRWSWWSGAIVFDLVRSGLAAAV
jgi:hypothetical protein